MRYPTEKILNTTVDIISMADIVADFSRAFNLNQKMTLTSVNPQIILMSEDNQIVKDFIETSSHRFADGIGVVKMSQWTGGNIQERIAGIDVMFEALKYANQHHKRIFLYGAKPEVVKKASTNIQSRFPNLVLAGYLDGYTSLPEADVVHKIQMSQADMLFVALGSPKQELWLAKHIPELPCMIYQTVGGSLDVISGTVKRAPAIFIKTNLEWVYRSFSDIKRINRMGQIPVFIGKAYKWHTTQKNNKES
ncbi:WecB/TagA/CpsF family glycosyltransferase [Vagococcus vulneris]|uniref:Glycosyltransferase n=1 Tax=Vagococcus vulneris TaxID=1977869 RepID=A0A429ZZW2_9ENTE|nr:WecB/TagA/CpsF family glycosyltransferase [Vagococcus vulneris]RST99559.1 glycosyltransferase [Vagococcus vulneris]